MRARRTLLSLVSGLRGVPLALGLAAGAGLWSPVAEAKFVFPQNHPDLEWQSIETEHFFVHYPTSKKSREDGNEHYLTAEYAARRTAQSVEQMWAEMCGELDYYLKEKIHVVVLNQSDDLEGFTIPSWDWVEISSNPGSYFFRMRGRMEWFSDVMIHEFAHVVSLKAGSAFSEGANGALVGGLYSNGIDRGSVGGTDTAAELYFANAHPWWWVEGGGEFWSDESGYYWWSAQRDQLLRTSVLEDRLLSFEEWSVYRASLDWNDGEREYQQGHAFAWYLRERFGPDTMTNLSKAYGEGWHPTFDGTFEEVVGVPLRQVYDDFINTITERYTAQVAEVKRRGEAEGYELTTTGRQPWDYTDAAGRDEWLKKLPRDREDKREASGTWQVFPKVSPDGRWYGLHDRGGLRVRAMDEQAVYALSGAPQSDPLSVFEQSRLTASYPMGFMHGWDFVPGQDAVVITGSEHSMEPGWASDHLRVELDGYNWNQIWYVNLTPYEAKKKGKTLEFLQPGSKAGTTVYEGAFPIPNTMRGADPVVSPDGEWVAYLEYSDGTNNVAVIRPDGTDKKLLTEFNDGTWFQGLDWSPDGKQLVFSMFKNYQQDLYVMNADGSGLKALTFDANEVQDAHWAWDGNIYFSAAPEGIFNIFRMNPESASVTQLTNVVGGANAPWLTPDGNLLYTNFTSHGWKTFAIPSEEFANFPAEHLFRFGQAIEPEQVAAHVGYEENLSAYAEQTTAYRPLRNLMSPTAVPLLQFGNDSLSNWNIQGGVQFYAQDFVEDHIFLAQALLGEDLDAFVVWGYQGWYPNFQLQYRHLEAKYDFAYALDADGDYNTTDDRTIYEGRNHQSFDLVALSVFFPWNSRLELGTFLGGYLYGFTDVSSARSQPFALQAWADLNARYSTILFTRAPANPRGGYVLDLNYRRGYSNVVYRPYYGVDVDDGELLDIYGFNQLEARYTHHIPVPDIFNKALGRPERDPTLQVDIQAGAIDRNVRYNDEFRAGGRHPYFWGSGVIQPNTQFSGYPAASLSGETMLMASLAYRFPLWTRIHRNVGPLHFDGLYMQFMGTAGNLWSFRPPTEPGTYYVDRFDQRIALDPSQIRREIPFVDYSYKNSPVDPVTGEVNPNYLLTDVGTELRLQATMFTRSTWNSFLRLAYGFNEIRGIGDVDGDDIIDTSDNTLGDSLSNETEKPGLRVYVGLGTGW